MNYKSLITLLYFLITVCFPIHSQAKTLKIALVQTAIGDDLEANLEKHLQYIYEAKEQNCRLVVFPEVSLFWSEGSSRQPTKNDLDQAIQQIQKAAISKEIYVIFGTEYKDSDNPKEKYHIRGGIIDPSGERLVFYQKNMEVPPCFFVDGIPVNLSICSDRGYLEHSDLPCIVQDSKVIIDTSGGHGGDDGRPDLRWIRYQPWAQRTNAFILVCNPVHEDADFMGHSPWGGGSAVIRPDGSIQASLVHEKEKMIIEEIDLEQANLANGKQRLKNLIFKSFWEAGRNLLYQKSIPAVEDFKPYASAIRDIKIAAAQIQCLDNPQKNIEKIISDIEQAAQNKADIVVFPELAITGPNQSVIANMDPNFLDAALLQIQKAAQSQKIYVIVGSPVWKEKQWQNGAIVINDEGKVLTTYNQITSPENGFFIAGSSPKAMWFQLKGVFSIVTIGCDSNWVEIGDLAATRGMYLHFHISNEQSTFPEEAKIRRQRNLEFLKYAKYGVVVNAAKYAHDNNGLFGESMIVSRVGGHNKSAPDGIEYYLPYQTSVIKSGGQEEELFYAVETTTSRNDLDWEKYWRNRNRRNRTQSDWDTWIKMGARIIEK